MAAQRHFSTADGVNIKPLGLPSDADNDIPKSGDAFSPPEQGGLQSLPLSPGASIDVSNAASGDCDASGGARDLLPHGDGVSGIASAHDADDAPEFDDNPLPLAPALPSSPPPTERSTAGDHPPRSSTPPIVDVERDVAAHALPDAPDDTAVERSQQEQQSPVRRSVVFEQSPVQSALAHTPQPSATNSEFESMMLEETDANYKYYAVARAFGAL